MDGSGEYTVNFIISASFDKFKEGLEQAKQSAKQFTQSLQWDFHEAVGTAGELDTKAKALLASITALEMVFAKDSLNAFAQYEDAMYGMATTVGNVGGTIQQAMSSIKEVTSNGLLSQTDASRAINNLTSYGYSVQEATTLIKELTNVSMAHRKEGESVSQQVEKLTEGIKRNSSMMLRSNGLMITATEAEQEYASATGQTTSELDKAEQRQAMYNAVVQAGTQSVSVASSYQQSYSASVQRMNNALEELRTAFGMAIAPFVKWISAVAVWMAENKQLVVGIGTFVGVLIGAGGLFVALSKIIPAVKSAIAWFQMLQVSTKSLIGVFGVLAAIASVVATAIAMNALAEGLSNITEGSEEAGIAFDDMGDSVGGAGGAVRDLTKDLERLERQYKDELKTIEQNHLKTINKLTKQIEDANVDYKRAIEERNAEFAVQQAQEEKKHQEKVDEIMTQIAFLQRYNNKYNQQKLANLQFALAKENALYKKQTEAEKAELELQNENDRKAFEEKRSQYQAELDEELAFMEKHREDLLEVQDWILEDEIDSLKRRHEEQIASYAEQAVSAGVGGTNIGTALSKGITDSMQDWFNNHAQDYTNMGNMLGLDFSEGIVNGLIDGFQKVGERIKGATLFTVNGQSMSVGDFMALYRRVQAVTPSISGFVNLIKSAFTGDWSDYQTSTGYASGGYTGQGNPNEIAGVVHKGEYVLPQEMVDQSTGTPKAVGSTYNIYVSGVFATSATERRRVADQIVTAINQNNKSRLEASWQ